MRLLADESCDFSVVRELRAAGHAQDDEVIAVASSERRLLVTEDKDFGQLVFSAAKENSGVILIRYPTSARSGVVLSLTQLLQDRGDGLYNCFVVLEPGRVRLGRLVT